MRHIALLVALLALSACSPAATPAHKLGTNTYQTVQFVWSENSSAAATTTVVGGTRFGFENYDFCNFDAKIVGATGGTVDVYLQKKLTTNVWADFAHLPQVAAGTTKFYNFATNLYATTPTNNGWGTDAAPTVVLAVNTVISGHPGDQLRLVTVTGASVTVAAAITIYATCRTQK